MKKNILAILFLVSVVSFGCNSGQDSKQSQAKGQAGGDSILKSQCYVAIDGSDTAYLTLDSRADDKISGKLLINFLNKPNNNGRLNGEFKGDTLFVDYTFTVGDNKTAYKNPLAFLSDSGKLILGVGTIETYLGRSYFAKGKPIDFAKGRFRFDSLDCKDQNPAVR